MISRSEFREMVKRDPDGAYDLFVAVHQRLEALEARLAKDSTNSSRSPSTDLSRKRSSKKRSLREPTDRHPGGQPGHEGCTLEPVEQPDFIVKHRPGRCPECDHDLAAVEAVERFGRQVFDLPPMVYLVTEHQVETVVCPCCQAVCRGHCPEGVTQPTQYGPGVMALALYANVVQLLPLRRVQQLFRDLFGSGPSEGTLVNERARAFQKLAPFDAAAREALLLAEVVHFDETGARVNLKAEWIHTACTELLTLYARHPHRGRQALLEIDILPRFHGVAIHDGLSAYRCLPYPCQHGTCNAHHLRELKAMEDIHKQSWARQMMVLLRFAYGLVKRAKAAGQKSLDPAVLTRIEAVYKQIVERGLKENPRPEPTGKGGRPKLSEARNLLERLAKYPEDVLRFASDFRVPFDNNQAERDIRMVKLQQKTSGCFRSEEGADQFLRIRGYVSTLAKHGLGLLHGLREVCRGAPIIPF